MTDTERIERLEAEVKSLKADHENLWQAINSLRHSPAIDVSRLDNVMQNRYGVRPPLRG